MSDFDCLGDRNFVMDETPTVTYHHSPEFPSSVELSVFSDYLRDRLLPSQFEAFFTLLRDGQCPFCECDSHSDPFYEHHQPYCFFSQISYKLVTS